MKKLFYTLVLTLSCGLAANATVPMMSVQKSTSANTNVKEMPAMKVSPEAIKATASLKAVSSTKRVRPVGRQLTAEDFVGEYAWKGSDPIQDPEAPMDYLDGSMSISVDPTNSNQLLIYGLDFYSTLADQSLYGYVQDNKLVIPNQFILRNTYYNVDVFFYNMSLKNNTPTQEVGYYFNTDPGTNFYLEMDVDGNLVAGAADLDTEKFDNHGYTDSQLAQMVCIASDRNDKDLTYVWWVCSWIQAMPVTPWEYKAEAWRPVGIATFKDAWLPMYWDNLDTPDYEVELYRNYNNEYEFMLWNPYGPETPYGENNYTPANEMGNLVFNIQEPMCVTFKPLVYSCTINVGTNEEPVMEGLYFCNQEGYYHEIVGVSLEDIIVNFTNERLNLSSFYADDPNGPLVEIFNGCFGANGVGSSIAANYTWQFNDGEPVPMEGYVILSDDYDSVQDVISDMSSAPVVYYNLQGTRVINPEKGQLVIARQGNKAKKLIVR